MNFADLYQAVCGQSEFVEFNQGPIHGLWRINGDSIDILAVESDHPGRGDFSKWLRVVMQQYERVRFLHVGNDVLRKYLLRKGFRDVEWFEGNELVEGMRWSR